MKKIGLLTAAVALLAAAAFPQHLSFALKAGAGWAGGGDLAGGLSGLMDYYSDAYSGLTGRHSFATMGWTLRGEVLLHFGSRWALGLEAGYERHGRESLVSYGFGALSASETLSPILTAIPLIGAGHVFIPAGKIKLDIQAGAGAYLTRLDWRSSYALSVLGYEGVDDFSFSGSRIGFGVQAGASLEWPLSPRLALVAGVCGRYVRISGYQGDWTETGSGELWSFSETGSGRLYAYDWTDGGSTYRQIAVQSGLPEGSAIANAREARIDLTGWTATAGIRISLF